MLVFVVLCMSLFKSRNTVIMTQKPVNSAVNSYLNLREQMVKK